MLRVVTRVTVYEKPDWNAVNDPPPVQPVHEPPMRMLTVPNPFGEIEAGYPEAAGQLVRAIWLPFESLT